MSTNIETQKGTFTHGSRKPDDPSEIAREANRFDLELLLPYPTIETRVHASSVIAKSLISVGDPLGRSRGSRLQRQFRQSDRFLFRAHRRRPRRRVFVSGSLRSSRNFWCRLRELCYGARALTCPPTLYARIENKAPAPRARSLRRRDLAGNFTVAATTTRRRATVDSDRH